MSETGSISSATQSNPPLKDTTIESTNLDSVDTVASPVPTQGISADTNTDAATTTAPAEEVTIPKVTEANVEHRFLLSLREAAALIGKKGATIKRIREDNDVKIAINASSPLCTDRILQCNGSIENVSKAIVDCLKVIKENVNKPTKPFSFSFLNSLMSKPTTSDFKNVKTDEDLENVQSIRLILSTSMIGAVIGKNGNIIKKLMEDHDVRIVASKRQLPDSFERILEIQGLANEIAECLTVVSHIVLANRVIDPKGERRYVPHAEKHARNNNNTNTKKYTGSVVVPEKYVGTLIGVKGSRINNLRSFTNTEINIVNFKDEATNENKSRFTIVGKYEKNVKTAESMLIRNLEAERVKSKNREARTGGKKSDNQADTNVSKKGDAVNASTPIAVEF
ncbi:KH domain-containing protein NDAI_0A07680 [Naumovozyma dairenensis CBS 421]|uniref:K Homology domain-containing protein n=1 Tax=Naumovozyma dairenensis (strain ATCC 10597 / BCRC 20456 / CBS 421 / NBRC 0211 / NRRL Y-12639) TaxID=1071378 RepID=G0W534_NAUDC|nr:hypothetical protein NDAI_0A07680 [Naumovozyma dairenensis CBS 421]CCD22922.1 hypothetical protein NDAI_0A07680 [Naumovozyma dairenensis CBS 421]